MGFFSFQQDLAIDLGTANTRIIYKDRIIVNEPSVIAFNTITGKMKAIGDKARQMYGKTHEDIKIIRPVRNGVISDSCKRNRYCFEKC
jgi:rod shape-determining protein MreB and related proteins